MEIRDFLNYFKKMKWMLIIPLILCTVLSGAFTYFNRITYNSTFTIIIGPQSVIGKDGKFRTNLAYVLSDILENEMVVSQVAKETGLSLDKYALKGMVGMVVDDQHQRIQMTVSSGDREAVKSLSLKLPDIIVRSANQLFYVDNLLVLGSDGAIFETGKNYKRNVAAGAVGGLGLGLLTIFVLLIFDDRLRDKKGLKRLFGIDYLGVINKSSEGKDYDEKGLPLVSARLLLKAGKNSSKVIGALNLSSVDMGDSLLKLGNHIAGLNSKVLIINGDKSSSAFSSVEKGNTKHGLYDMLTGQKDYTKEIVVNPSNKNLDILPFGSGDNLELSLLMDSRLKDYLAVFEENYDIILFNMPYKMGMEKIVTLASLFDMTVFTMEEGDVKVSLAEEVIGVLKDTGINMQGYYIVS